MKSVPLIEKRDKQVSYLKSEDTSNKVTSLALSIIGNSQITKSSFKVLDKAEQSSKGEPSK